MTRTDIKLIPLSIAIFAIFYSCKGVNKKKKLNLRLSQILEEKKVIDDSLGIIFSLEVSNFYTTNKEPDTILAKVHSSLFNNLYERNQALTKESDSLKKEFEKLQ